MIEVVFTPQWFYGKDLIIDFISLLVLLFIAYFSFSYFRLNKQIKYCNLSLSFLLLALSFIFKIMMNFTIYYNVLETKKIGFITFSYNVLKSSDTLFFVGFLVYRLLTLIGLYMLYSLYKKQPKTNIFLIAYLLIISTYFTQSAYYVFHMTSLILLVMITYEMFRNYKKKKHNTTKWLTISFGIITLSQILFIYVKLNHNLYVIGEVIQLVGYVLLMITFLKVLYYGKKK
jgi:hypothetical protein